MSRGEGLSDRRPEPDGFFGARNRLRKMYRLREMRIGMSKESAGHLKGGGTFPLLFENLPVDSVFSFQGRGVVWTPRPFIVFFTSMIDFFYHHFSLLKKFHNMY